jgi:hypothetical protein
VYNCRLTVSSAEGGGGGGPETEPIYLDVTTLREPEKQIAETKLRDTEENRSFFMPILGRYYALQRKSDLYIHFLGIARSQSQFLTCVRL